jgi:hypothetical protein
LLVWSNATQRTEEVWPSSVETETFMGQELRATFVVVFMCCLPGNSLRWTREREEGEGWWVGVRVGSFLQDFGKPLEPAPLTPENL